jgi:hypothetical protein
MKHGGPDPDSRHGLQHASPIHAAFMPVIGLIAHHRITPVQRQGQGTTAASLDQSASEFHHATIAALAARLAV